MCSRLKIFREKYSNPVDGKKSETLQVTVCVLQPLHQENNGGVMGGNANKGMMGKLAVFYLV